MNILELEENQPVYGAYGTRRCQHFNRNLHMHKNVNILTKERNACKV